MKNSKNNLLFIALLAIGSFMTLGFSGNEPDNEEIITVRTTEVLSGVWDNSMTTVYANGEVEKVELEKLKFRNLSTNLTTVNKHLNSLASKGYKLISVAGGNGDGIIVTTYTFGKE
jgi:hypothetical protein